MKKVDWLDLVVGAALLAAGICALIFPGFSLAWVVALIAIAAIIRGAGHLIHYFRLKKYVGYSNSLAVIIGILDVIVGVYLATHTTLGATVLAIVFPLWFIMDSIFGFAFLGILKLIDPARYWLTVLFNVLGIVAGFILLFNPLASMETLSMLIAFCLLLFGGYSVFMAFQGGTIPGKE